jgi:hypothetical protein
MTVVSFTQRHVSCGDSDCVAPVCVVHEMAETAFYTAAFPKCGTEQYVGFDKQTGSWPSFRQGLGPKTIVW